MDNFFFGQPVNHTAFRNPTPRPNEIGGAVETAEKEVPDGQMLSMLGQIGITQEDVDRALTILEKYKDAKKNLESEVIENERWYQMRHWEILRRGKTEEERKRAPQPEPTSGWLFNSLANKHADAMDNFPDANVLPREENDRQDAKTLSSILPVVLERCDFEGAYSHNWWEKLKHGTGVYSVLWDNTLENGLGDIIVKPVDLLNIFWEPGISDIQDSRNVFVLQLMDKDILIQQYPQLEGKLGEGCDKINISQYIYDDSIDLSQKSAVIDWYYKVRSPSGRTLLHYVKIAGGQLLYASQNDPDRSDTGWYAHGKYPFVFDVLFPEKGYPTGFGYVSVCKDPQLYIDKLMANIMENSLQNSKIRFLSSEDSIVNEEELTDYTKNVIHVEGRIDDSKLKQLVTSPLDGAIINVLQMKIDEMKETASNRDVSQGGTTGGATAAAAIAALQEAGNKVSRDIINGSYRQYTKMGYLVIELIRQFYDEAREFRITGENGEYNFVDFSNKTMKQQVTGEDSQGVQTFREPVFDLKIRAQKRSPFAREAQNQRAMEMYQAGMFSPENATPALACLDMMEFEGVEQVRQKIAEGQTLLVMLQETQQQLQIAMEMLGMRAASGGQSPAAGQQGAQPQGGGNGIDNRMAAAQTPQGMTPYGKRLAQMATPNASGN